MSAVRWSLSPLDFHAHAIIDGDSSRGVLVGHCGHQLPAAAGVDQELRGAQCAACALMVAPQVLGLAHAHKQTPPDHRRKVGAW